MIKCWSRHSDSAIFFNSSERYLSGLAQSTPQHDKQITVIRFHSSGGPVPNGLCKHLRACEQCVPSRLQQIMPCLYAVCCKITSFSFTRVSGWMLNGIWSFLRLCLQASRFPFERVKESPQDYLGLNSGRLVLINLSKTRKHFSRNNHGAHVSPMFPSFPYGKHCFQCQFLFLRCKLCVRYTAGNLTKI